MIRRGGRGEDSTDRAPVSSSLILALTLEKMEEKVRFPPICPTGVSQLVHNVNLASTFECVFTGGSSMNTYFRRSG